MPGVHPGGQGSPPSQEKGRGVMGYLMPIYTVAILILFVYTAMKVSYFPWLLLKCLVFYQYFVKKI